MKKGWRTPFSFKITPRRARRTGHALFVSGFAVIPQSRQIAINFLLLPYIERGMRAAHVPLEAAAGNQRSSYGESPPRGRGRADKTGTGRLRKPCIAPCAGRLHRNSAGPGISQRRVLRHRRAYGDAGPYPAEIPAKASGKAGCGSARHSAQRAVSGALSDARACARPPAAKAPRWRSTWRTRGRWFPATRLKTA